MRKSIEILGEIYKLMRENPRAWLWEGSGRWNRDDL